jgi:predicted ATPase
MKKVDIKGFFIFGLFGYADFKIPFKDNLTIFVGENGIGKTTVLSLLNYLLRNDLSRIKDYDFDNIELLFNPKIDWKKQEEGEEGEKKVKRIQEKVEQKLYIKRKELDNYQENLKEITNILPLIETYFDKIVLYRMINTIRIKDMKESQIREIPAIGANESIIKDNVLDSIVQNIIKLAQNILFIVRARNELIILEEIGNTEILFLPTYRRIEGRWSKSDIEQFQFLGMRDISKTLESIRTEIKSIGISGFAFLKNELVNQIIENQSFDNSANLENISLDVIGIMLNRIGETISEENKNIILEIVKEKSLSKCNSQVLYFINKLNQIYHTQEDKINSIRKLIEICNKYLASTQRKLIYDENEVDIIYESRSKRKHLLAEVIDFLSLGERQLISIFAQIYLSDNKTFLVIFDEPELSISVYWQEMFLPDIMSSGKCEFMIAATHSPFIFSNNLENHAIGLNEYMEYRNDA